MAVNPKLSPAERLKSLISGRTAPAPVIIEVPGSTEFTVRYRTDVTIEEADEWRKRVPANMDPAEAMVLGAAIQLSESCVGILVDGEPWTNEGVPVTFGSKVLHETVGTDEWVEAVRRFYGTKGALLAVAQAHQARCPEFSTVAAVVDPTKGSSKS